MLYFAKVNTADPRIGLITTGEMLTQKQANALGQEKIDELVRRGVLGEMNSSGAGAPNTPRSASQTAPIAGEPETPQSASPTDPLAGEPDDEELPTLEGIDEIVGGEEPAEDKKAPTKNKSRGRGKGK